MWMIRFGSRSRASSRPPPAVIFSGDPSSAYAPLLPLALLLRLLLPLARATPRSTIVFWRSVTASRSPSLEHAEHRQSTSVGDLTHHFVLTVGSSRSPASMITSSAHQGRRALDAAPRRPPGPTSLTGLLNSHGLAEPSRRRSTAPAMSASRVGLLTVRGRPASASSRPPVRPRRPRDDALREVGRLLRRVDPPDRHRRPHRRPEFAIVLPETDEHTGFLLAEQILARLRRTYRERDHGAQRQHRRRRLPQARRQRRGAAAGRAAGRGGRRTRSAPIAPSSSAPSSRTRSPPTRAGQSVSESRDPPEHGPQPRRGPRPARRPQRRATRCRGALLRDARPSSSASRSSGSSASASRARSTTSARSASPTRSSTSPGPLSPAEWDQVRRHPEMAARILGARELTDIREWVSPATSSSTATATRGALRRGDPARVTDPRGRRVLRRDDERAPLPPRAHRGRGDRGVRPLLRQPVRRRRRRRAGPRPRRQGETLRSERPATRPRAYAEPELSARSTCEVGFSTKARERPPSASSETSTGPAIGPCLLQGLGGRPIARLNQDLLRGPDRQRGVRRDAAPPPRWPHRASDPSAASRLTRPRS